MARSRRTRRTHRRPTRGGGFQTGPDFVSAGNPVIQAYSGAGKDCPSDTPLHRDGYIDPVSYGQKGLPGMSGGARLVAAESLPYGDVISVPSVPSTPQKGGAYTTLLAPLNPSNGIGGSALPSLQTIPCAQRYPMQGGGQGADMMMYRAPKRKKA